MVRAVALAAVHAVGVVAHLTCPTEGFGPPGGYRIHLPRTRMPNGSLRPVKAWAVRSAMGPAEDLHKRDGDIYVKERPHEQQDVRRAGLRSIEPQLCLNCHDARAPTIADDCLRLKVDSDSLHTGHGFHQHFPLEYSRP